MQAYVFAIGLLMIFKILIVNSTKVNYD